MVECVNEFLDKDQEREQREQLFERYINSLDLQSVENINNMIDREEFAANEDLAELDADMDE